MQKLVFVWALCALGLGCAVDTAIPAADDSGEWAEEAVGKDDRGVAYPQGLFLFEGDADEGQPRYGTLDLRADRTMFIEEFGPVDNGGNFQEGVNTVSGTFRYLYSARTGKRRLSFRDTEYGTTDTSWPYTYSRGTLSFYYPSNGEGFTMKRVTPPNASWVFTMKTFLVSLSEGDRPEELVRMNLNTGESRLLPPEPVRIQAERAQDQYDEAPFVYKVRASRSEGSKGVGYIVWARANDQDFHGYIFSSEGQLMAEGTSVAGGKLSWNTKL